MAADQEPTHLCRYEEASFPDSQFGSPRHDGRREHLGTSHLDDGSIIFDPPMRAPDLPE